MYIYVLVQEKEEYYTNGPDGIVKARLEAVSGERCLVVPYQEFCMDTVREFSPTAIVMSGFGRYLQSRRVKWFYGIDEVLHQTRMPVLCICGSHQVMGYSFNTDFRRLKQMVDQPIRRIGKTEDFPRPALDDPLYDKTGHFYAKGFFPIRRLRRDPIFDGLPESMLMHCSHYCEMKRVPPGFIRLAESAHSRIEAIRHRTRPLYGVQFHPEKYALPFMHGKRLLENFANIASRFRKQHTSTGKGE